VSTVLEGPGRNADVWTMTGVLETVSLERWNVLLGDLAGR
jgi:hypothetical protein